MKCKGSICHEYSKQNIDTSKKRINKIVRVTPNFVEWSCASKSNKLMRTLFFVERPSTNERNISMKTLIFGQIVVYK